MKQALNCPACGRDDFEIVRSYDDRINFLCTNCGTCWHQWAGYLISVSELKGCSGCDHQHPCGTLVKTA